MSWASFFQIVIAVILGGWLKGGKSAIPGQQTLDKLVEALGRRIRGKNGQTEIPELPRAGV